MKEKFEDRLIFHKLVNKVPVPCNITDPEYLKNRNKIVQKSQITKGIFVNTKFLGRNIDTSSDKPFFFRTIVFGGELNRHTCYSSTWKEAEENHTRICVMIIDTL